VRRKTIPIAAFAIIPSIFVTQAYTPPKTNALKIFPFLSRPKSIKAKRINSIKTTWTPLLVYASLPLSFVVA